MKTYKAYYRKYISPKEYLTSFDLLQSNKPEDVKKHFSDKFPFNKVVVTSLERVRNKTEKSNDQRKTGQMACEIIPRIAECCCPRIVSWNVVHCFGCVDVIWTIPVGKRRVEIAR